MYNSRTFPQAPSRPDLAQTHQEYVVVICLTSRTVWRGNITTGFIFFSIKVILFWGKHDAFCSLRVFLAPLQHPAILFQNKRPRPGLSHPTCRSGMSTGDFDQELLLSPHVHVGIPPSTDEIQVGPFVCFIVDPAFHITMGSISYGVDQ